VTQQPVTAPSADRHAWERPGAFEELPGVFRIPLPLPGDHLKAVNTYAIVDGDTVVMVDSGWALADSEALLEQALNGIGHDLGSIREFLVTHVHRDHYTQALTIRRRFGSRVGLGDGEQLALSTLRSLSSDPDEAALRVAGAGALLERTSITLDPNLRDWEDPDVWLADRAQLEIGSRTLQVIATPGHTRGHVVFHDRASNALFAGDHVLPHITPSIGIEAPRPVFPQSPLSDYLRSLRLVQELPDAVLLPAHGPVAPSAHQRIAELLAHHERRLDDTAAAVAAGAHTGYEAARALTWTRHERPIGELDPMNQRMAVHETMAHLAVLVERGRLRRSTVDGVTHFEPA
jgi:glyoxylase-like metal-dependent hydrolase (beta-lactamase superfamily II)